MDRKGNFDIDPDVYADWEEAFEMYAENGVVTVDKLRLVLLNLGRDLAEPELNAFCDNQGR